MASSTKSAGTGANLTGVGSNAWSNTSNIVSANGAYATNSQGDTNYLKASNFGFSIPSTATITGVVVSIKRMAGSSNRVNDTYLYLVNSSGNPSGNNKASGSYWPTSNTVATYGASNDLWGLTLTPTDVNDVDFGVALACDDNYVFIVKPHVTAYVDHIEITIYYSDLVNIACSITNTATATASLHRMIGCVTSISQVTSLASALSTYVNLTSSIQQVASLITTLKINAQFAVAILQNFTLSAICKLNVRISSFIEQEASIIAPLRIAALMTASIHQTSQLIPKGSSSWTDVDSESVSWENSNTDSTTWVEIDNSTNWTEL